MANSEDLDQTAPKESSLTWVSTVCSHLSVPILGVFMVLLDFIPIFGDKECFILIEISKFCLLLRDSTS